MRRACGMSWVGHDWGSAILGRSAVYHPERFSKLAFLSVGYILLGALLDIDAINNQGLKDLGYTPFGYSYFFNSYDTADIASKNVHTNHYRNVSPRMWSLRPEI
jgi:pimeloyl-ACP methyl ester carboxylesterase